MLGEIAARVECLCPKAMVEGRGLVRWSRFARVVRGPGDGENGKCRMVSVGC